MKKIERITKNIENDKELVKNLKKIDVSTDQFIADMQTYLRAVAERRIHYHVDTVSKSGMSRTIIITSCEGSRGSHYYRQYNAMLEALGYSVKRGYTDSIRVHGCGMNMLFATNYNIIRSAYRLGFISLKKCRVLEQMVN